MSTFTYYGTQIRQDWMPAAPANGVEDEARMPVHDRSNLYRWSSPLCRIDH